MRVRVGVRVGVEVGVRVRVRLRVRVWVRDRRRLGERQRRLGGRQHHATIPHAARAVVARVDGECVRRRAERRAEGGAVGRDELLDAVAQHEEERVRLEEHLAG